MASPNLKGRNHGAVIITSDMTETQLHTPVGSRRYLLAYHLLAKHIIEECRLVGCDDVWLS
jgi:hypothetical protein